MIHNGDVFLTKLEHSLFGAFRVLKTGGRFDFSPYEFYVIALTSYVDTKKPEITDPRLRTPLCAKRFFNQGQVPCIMIYSGQLLEKNFFEYLGNIPLVEEEEKIEIEIEDFPLAGEIPKDFGVEAFLEWRWEHEREAMLGEIQEPERQKAETIKSLTSETAKAQAYRYRDEKSDKFWRIEYTETALSINYGKTGTTGKYQLKEFDRAEQCAKEAGKMIAAKVKKGYQDYPDFAPNEHFYFDDEDAGLHPLTSHPHFRMHFVNDLYYDCTDEEAPFGSDEGADTLAQIFEDLRQNKGLNFSEFPRKMTEIYFGLIYLPAENLSRPTVERLVKKDKLNLTQSDMVTYATAFAQIKITGRLDAGLKTAALNALRRMIIVADVLGWTPTGKPSEIMEIMVHDLERFPSA